MNARRPLARKDDRVSRRWTRAALAWAFISVPYVIGLAMLLATTGGLGSSINARGSTFLALTYGILAGILIAHVPRHPIAWLFAATAGISAVDVLVAGLIERALAVGSADLVARSLAVVESVIWIPQMWALMAIAFFFPDGRLTSPAWRPVFALVTLGLAAGVVAYGSLPGPVDQWPALVNPIGVPGGDDLRRTYTQSATALVAIIAVASALVRFRSARGDERAQLKWFAFAAVAAGLTLAPGAMLYFAPPPLSTIAVAVATIPLAFLFPLAVGTAVLRYRLYDVDLLIRRTLVYGAVSGVLLASYGAAVVSLQTVLRPLTAGSDLAVAASTLLVVALFQPIRRRAQRLVDRRFYRSRYDASRAVDLFASRLRDEVELDAVRTGLVSVVDETLRPAHASVWLRGSPR
jgi:hypothetical protein